MAVIPPDAGVRMRMQAEASLVEQLQPVRPISSDLPDLRPGQAFTARVIESLPENTYKALVAGRQLTLQLPEGAETGDTLELVLIDRTPKMLIARRAESPLAADAANQAYAYSKISTAGRMIGQLLLREGETPQPAALNRGQPLLAHPPASAAELVPNLAKAVSQSGLFYESHQAQWLAGRRPLVSLRAEPQGQLPVPPRPVTEGVSSVATPTVEAAPETRSSLPTGTAARVDIATSQRLAWHGEAWPGQGIDWKIERDTTDEHPSGQADAEAPRWTTTLRLTMPRLGAIDAQLQLTGSNLRLRIAAPDGRALEALRGQAAELTRVLADAGLTVAALDIYREP